ncbi:hypothetical protein CR513_22446, partial [Mucuna pruriens]
MVGLSSHPILWFCSIGTLEVFHPNFSVSLRRSSTYFRWEIKMPCFEYATSILRDYFSFHNSFISNCVANFSFRVSLSISSSPVSMKEGIFNIKLGKCFLIIYSISLCIPFSNQSCFISIKGPIRFTLHSVYPSTTYNSFAFVPINNLP